MVSSNAASDFLELASEQRLEIIKLLATRKAKLSEITKILGATKSEVHRNLERLIKTGIIQRDADGYYFLGSVGTAMHTQISLAEFVSKNKQYLKTHKIGSLPEKFIRRLGSLGDAKTVKGIVKVMDIWEQIYSGSEMYIYNILNEVSYSSDVVKILADRLDDDVTIRSIFLHSASVSRDRKKVYDKTFRKFASQGRIQRKMTSKMPALVVMSEKEACVLFPNTHDEYDISLAFYSNSKEFHEWCFDYFADLWDKSDDFKESLLNS